MPSRKRSPATRCRVGRVSMYLHHGAWWLYYRDHGRPVRRRLTTTREEAQQIAAQVNAQLSSGAPTLLAFEPISVSDLRLEFLRYHELVLRSSMATVRRYRAATQYLEDFVRDQPRPAPAHEVRPDAFAAHLRTVAVTPNGHRNTALRRLRDKGVQYILETCRTMYTFASRRRHLPPYAANPFSALPLDRFKIQDAKPIFVFDCNTELAFFRTASDWSFAVHFTLAKTGLRVGELVHLLIEDLDLEGGWLLIRNKTALGWRVKTGTERNVPLLPEHVAVLRRTIGERSAGPVFLRERVATAGLPLFARGRRELELICEERQRGARQTMSRSEMEHIARTVWRDSGAVRAGTIRTSFISIMRSLGHPEATCPKSWRHTFATLLQDGDTDPLIRQLTLGHKPTVGTGLGMTANYTHTRPETLRRQIEQALRRWPEVLELAAEYGKGGVQ